MTLSPIVIFLLSISPWTGLWRVQMVDSERAATHILVRPDLSIELFEPNWSYIFIEEAHFNFNELKLVGRADAGTQIVDLHVNLIDSKRFEGLVEMTIGGGQFKAAAQVQGLKVVPFTPPEPPKWIADARAQDMSRIDILGKIVREAPRDSFDSFLKFWDQQIEWKYYIFLQSHLYGAQSNQQTRLSRLHALFDSLQGVEADSLKELEGQAIAAIPARLRRGLDTGMCKVLIPVFSNDHPTVEQVAVVRVPYPDGERPCCSFRNFKAEPFLFLPIPLNRPAESP